MSSAKTIIRNVFSNWIGLIFNLILAFFLSPFIVHKLGNLYYGIWVIMMQLVGYMGLMELGVRESIIRYVAKYISKKNYDELNNYIGASLTVYFFLSILSIIIALVIAYLFPLLFNIHDEEAIYISRIVVILTGINVAQGFFFNVYYGVIMGMQRYDVHNLISIIYSVIRAILIIIFLYSGYGIIALGLIQLGISFLSNFTVYLWLKKSLPQIKSSLFVRNRSIYKSMVNYSWFVFLNNMSEKIIFYTDALIIGAFLSPIYVTYFSIPGTLIEYMRRIIMQMSHVFSPLTSELQEKKDESRILEVLINGTKFSLLIGLPICIIFITSGYNFIKLWMGKEYADAAELVLIILTCTQIFSITQYTTVSILYGLNKHYISAYARMIEAFGNLVLSLILVKPFGIVGVAIGTAIPNFIIVTFVYPFFITKVLNIKIMKFFTGAFIKPIITNTIFFGLAFGINESYTAPNLIFYFIQMLLLLIFYLIITWFTSFDQKEKSNYLPLLKKALFIK